MAKFLAGVAFVLLNLLYSVPTFAETASIFDRFNPTHRKVVPVTACVAAEWHAPLFFHLLLS